MRRPARMLAFVLAAALLLAATDAAGQAGPANASRDAASAPGSAEPVELAEGIRLEGVPPLQLDGAPPPAFPIMLARDDAGRATIRAVRIDRPLRLDGVLDEEVFQVVPPFGDMIQAAPVHGAPASERSDVWILHDDTHVYVICRCWDSAPPGEWVVNELRRDSSGLRNNDHFGVLFDTFYDRRSGFAFYANPLGARADYSVVDEGGSNADWDPVWEVGTGRFDGGWIVEMAIPFKSLRYRSGSGQVWGIQLRRSIRRKNEWAYLNPVPASMAGPQALNRVSAGGTLVGLDLPPAGRNVELRPYATARTTRDAVLDPAGGARRDADVGIDLRYGVTAHLTADFTWNTDFAQVEVDEQQVNLTRFSLFFPEKREFFLEGRGNFDFGRGTQGFNPMAMFSSDVPYLFYSRRIGFEAGEVVPIRGGARLTGKAGDWGIGAVHIHTAAVAGPEPPDPGGGDAGPLSPLVPANRFSVLRVKRDVLRRSNVGAMFTHRADALAGDGANRGWGVDGTFRFFENVTTGGYFARTDGPLPIRPGVGPGTDPAELDRSSWQASLDWNHDRYGVETELLNVGNAFNPEVGFVRRADFLKSAATLRFSPRPAGIASVRKFTWEASVDHFKGLDGRLQSRQQQGRFSTEFESSDRLNLDIYRNFERLDRPFPVGPGLAVAPGAYPFTDVRASLTTGPQRRVSGTVSVRHGDFYDGTLTGLGLSGARVVVTNHLSVEPGLTLNRIRLPQGDLDQTLLRARIDYAFTPRMFASTLVQHNSVDRSLSSNLRFRWEYRPGSEFFVVWTDERDTGDLAAADPRTSRLRNRALVVKATRLFQF